jgi:hypothetical protein
MTNIFTMHVLKRGCHSEDEHIYHACTKERTSYMHGKYFRDQNDVLSLVYTCMVNICHQNDVLSLVHAW